MAPNLVDSTGTTVPVTTNHVKVSNQEKEIKRDQIFSRFDKPFYFEQHRINMFMLAFGHSLALYYCYLMITTQIPWGVTLLGILTNVAFGMGNTVGAHRYWTHKTFKAKLPLEILLMILQTGVGQYPIHKWCLDHRLHHKYTDTDADPHNSKRGFWYSHIGWLLVPKTPELEKKLKCCDMSDLENDPVVRFQSKYYWSLVFIIVFLLPTYAFYYIFSMPFLHCLAANGFRYAISLHGTMFVNSIAHLWGNRPYDRNITAVDNAIVSLIAYGEGWHNYHHVFPWDYKTSEYAWKINISTMFIDFFAWIGWAYDMKTVSQEMLQARFVRTGDGSHSSQQSREKKVISEFTIPEKVTEYLDSIDEGIWGWDDDKIPDSFREATTILKPEKAC